MARIRESQLEPQKRLIRDLKQIADSQPHARILEAVSRLRRTITSDEQSVQVKTAVDLMSQELATMLDEGLDVRPNPPMPQLPSPLASSPTCGTLYLYWDERGWGTLEITKVGCGHLTGVQLISCRLKQNGDTFEGSGVYHSGLLVFTINNCVFQCSPTGWGSFHPAGNPSDQKWFYLYL